MLKPLRQLLNLAIKTPEKGIVNFELLRILLHAMLTELNITDVEADIHKDFDLTDVSVISLIEGGAEHLREDDTEDERRIEDSDDGKTEIQMPIRSKVPYKSLQRKVDDLAKKMEDLNALPSNKELFARTTMTDGERTVSDMWQFMQLKKRVDANQDGVSKASFMHAK